MILFRSVLCYIFLIGVGFLIISASVPMSVAQYNSMITTWNTLQNSVKSESLLSLFVTIFLNNIRVLIIDTVPLLGSVFYFLSLYETAALLHVGVAGTPSFSLFASASAVGLFAVPDTPLEILSYTFPVTASLYFLVHQFSTRKVRLAPWYSIIFTTRRDFVNYCKLLARAFVYGLALLALAALFEATVVTSILFLFILWVPTFLVLVFLFNARVFHKLPVRVQKFLDIDQDFTLP